MKFVAHHRHVIGTAFLLFVFGCSESIPTTEPLPPTGAAPRMTVASTDGRDAVEVQLTVEPGWISGAQPYTILVWSDPLGVLRAPDEGIRPRRLSGTAQDVAAQSSATYTCDSVGTVALRFELIWADDTLPVLETNTTVTCTADPLSTFDPQLAVSVSPSIRRVGSWHEVAASASTTSSSTLAITFEVDAPAFVEAPGLNDLGARAGFRPTTGGLTGPAPPGATDFAVRLECIGVGSGDVQLRAVWTDPNGVRDSVERTAAVRIECDDPQVAGGIATEGRPHRLLVVDTASVGATVGDLPVGPLLVVSETIGERPTESGLRVYTFDGRLVERVLLGGAATEMVARYEATELFLETIIEGPSVIELGADGLRHVNAEPSNGIGAAQDSSGRTDRMWRARHHRDQARPVVEIWPDASRGFDYMRDNEFVASTPRDRVALAPAGDTWLVLGVDVAGGYAIDHDQWRAPTRLFSAPTDRPTAIACAELLPERHVCWMAELDRSRVLVLVYERGALVMDPTPVTLDGATDGLIRSSVRGSEVVLAHAAGSDVVLTTLDTNGALASPPKRITTPCTEVVDVALYGAGGWAACGDIDAVYLFTEVTR